MDWTTEDEQSDAAALALDKWSPAAARVAPFLSDLQVFAWVHYYSRDVKRSCVPQQLLGDHKGTLQLVGKTADEIKALIKPYKTIVNAISSL